MYFFIPMRHQDGWIICSLLRFCFHVTSVHPNLTDCDIIFYKSSEKSSWNVTSLCAVGGVFFFFFFLHRNSCQLSHIHLHLVWKPWPLLSTPPPSLHVGREMTIVVIKYCEGSLSTAGMKTSRAGRGGRRQRGSLKHLIQRLACLLCIPPSPFESPP